MSLNPLIELEAHGQSIWLDYISRELIESGTLLRLINDDHLKGITSNPSIFEKSITKTHDYDHAIATIGRKKSHDIKAIYENIAIKDIKDAADILLPVYKSSQGLDGFVSLEVSPDIAFDSHKSIEEGKRLWQEVKRPNLMIKIPGTKEGMIAIKELIMAGINVNVTLLFSLSSYQNAALAYVDGLKERVKKGLSIDSIHSVASFFISRIDSYIDKLLVQIIEKNIDPETTKLAQSLKGSIAIANAQMAYLLFLDIYKSEDVKSLMKKGANPQRLLWASTGTKDKDYSDVLYIESLVGKNTVNTMPPTTLDAFRDHGRVVHTIEHNIAEAAFKMADLKGLGIDFKSCTDELLTDGIKLFSNSFQALLLAIKEKVASL